MFSSVLPDITECGPHELLPIMPPSVQRLCVAGSGAYVRACSSAASRSTSHTTPGSTSASRRTGSTSSTRLTYFEVSITTATLTLWPHIDVPPPRARIGASNSRHAATAATMSSTLQGTTTPMGTCR
jgi:hypothetical protein